jgi:tetratricopeptide (TPR) repeat protein
LLEGLAAEDRSGTPEFSNPTELTSRRAALETALAQTESAQPASPTPAATAVPPSAKDPYHLLARRYALNLARADLDSHPTGVVSWIDHIDALDGPNGYTAYLRAEFARRNSGSDNGVPAAIASYEKCVAFADAPPVAYRELGFLYRQAGDQSRARAALNKYLQQAPTAVDAPIIRTYLEAP